MDGPEGKRGRKGMILNKFTVTQTIIISYKPSSIKYLKIKVYYILKKIFLLTKKFKLSIQFLTKMTKHSF